MVGKKVKNEYEEIIKQNNIFLYYSFSSIVIIYI